MMTKEQLELTKQTIQNTLKLEKMNLSDRELELLAYDLDELIISIGGDFSVQNIRYYLLEMIKNDFYPRFLASHRNEL